MRLLVDMDAVIAHWGAEYDRMLDLAGAAGAAIPRTENQEHWNLHTGRTEIEQGIIRLIMQEPGFYRRLEPIPGAKQALKAALKAGHDVRIVSSPFISNPTCASDKLDWIVRHYGSHWASRVVLTSDKTVVHGDILVDDKPEITGSMEPTWTHVLFGDYAYNRAATGPRITEWSPETLDKLIYGYGSQS